MLQNPKGTKNKKKSEVRKKEGETSLSREDIDVEFFVFPDKIGGTRTSKTD
jgi:hypothetical protein